MKVLCAADGSEFSQWAVEAIGAALMGAAHVTFVEKDERALAIEPAALAQRAAEHLAAGRHPRVA